MAGKQLKYFRMETDSRGITVVTFDRPPVRAARLAEAITVLKGCFADGPFSFEGVHYTIRDYDGQPKPVQRPHPPLFIGGGGRRALLGLEDRPRRLAAPLERAGDDRGQRDAGESVGCGLGLGHAGVVELHARRTPGQDTGGVGRGAAVSHQDHRCHAAKPTWPSLGS